jgi:hypothetical protein
MANFLENVIEKMIRDGIVTESELQAKIEEERAKSPFNKVADESDSIGFLISFLMQHDENISMILSLAMMRIQKLEKEVEELKNA